MASRRSGHFNANVDADLLRLLEEVAAGYSPYDVELFSGYADRPTNKASYHPKGGAIDVNLIDRASGTALPNIRDPKSAQAYQAYANAVYQRASPEMKAKLRWGGYFQSGVPKDWMHFDIGGADRMAAGSWSGGFNPDVMKELGLSSAGGLDALDQQMQAAGYTPEQRRAAIASIESAGSGDYAARGKELGNDRALGRYQIMQSNLPEWSKQALGREVTANEFMADPKLQDQIFDAIYGGYVGKYGERGAASKWFTGSENEPQRSDVHGKLTGETYADRYMKALGAQMDSPSEGGARFGGTGLGTPTPAIAGAGAGAGGKEQSFGDKFAEGLGKSGGMPAAQGGSSLPELPRAALFQGEPTTVGDSGEIDRRKQKLAEMLARLNSGKLVV